jgi:hypothetical protein
MANDTQQRSGTPNNYESDRGGATLISEAVIGIVKNNVDDTHSGMVEVYIAKCINLRFPNDICFINFSF